MRVNIPTIMAIGTAKFNTPSGVTVEIPVFEGFLKHLPGDELTERLKSHATARKYSIEILRRAPWQVIKYFPNGWLLELIPSAGLASGRSAALNFLLS